MKYTSLKGPRPKGIRARLRVLYWNNDRLRRFVTWTRNNWFVVFGFMLGWALMQLYVNQVRDHADADRQAFFDVQDRNTKLNDQLRDVYNERRNLEQELRECREKTHAP